MQGTLALFVLLYFKYVSAYQSRFIQNCLAAHNQYRLRHGVPALRWSPRLAESAQKWANHLAAIDQMQHDESSGLGENIFFMFGGNPSLACQRAVRDWYQEGRNYDFGRRGVHPDTGRFSQVVWKSTKEVGVGTAESKSKNFFLVARYSPRGNVQGKYRDNVSPPLPGIKGLHSPPKTQRFPISFALAKQSTQNNFPSSKASVKEAEEFQIFRDDQRPFKQDMRVSSPSDQFVPMENTGPYLAENDVNNHFDLPQVPPKYNVQYQTNVMRPDSGNAKTQNFVSGPPLQQKQNDAPSVKPPPTPSSQGKDYRVEIKFPLMTFSIDMNQPGSSDFLAIKNNITYFILDLYEDYDEFQEVQLLSLRSGSVIAMLGLIFSQIGMGHLDLLTNAMKSGKLGNFAVDKNYISAVALPDGYLKLTRPVQPAAPWGNTCPQPCSKPIECYPKGCSVNCCSFSSSAVPSPASTNTCPSSCEDECDTECPSECCTKTGQLPATQSQSYISSLPAPASTSCPATCPFSCYPECSPQCCSTPTAPIRCPSYCPAVCRSYCTAQCCASGLAPNSDRLSYLRASYLQRRRLKPKTVRAGHQGRHI